MDWLRRLAERITRWRKCRDADAEIAEELRLHAELRTEELRESGMDDAAARHQAQRELGSSLAAIEDSREAWRLGWIEDLVMDLRYGARSLARDRGFALTAIASLALGIGVNTAVFSLASEFLFSEPSVRDTDSVVSIRLGGNSHASPQERQLLEDSQVYRGVGGYREAEANWRSGDISRRIFSFQVSSNFFALLGVPMQSGRWMESADHDVVILSHRFWKAAFQLDPSALNRVITLDGRPHTIIGILPESNRSVFGFGMSPDVYVRVDERREKLALYARMQDGMSRGEALERTRAAAAEMDRVHPDADYKRTDMLQVAGLTGIERLASKNMAPVTAFFGVLIAVVDLVLLIACINVAGLMLARASARTHEMAVRASIGASRGRIVRQLLAESLLLSVVAAAVGIGINVMLTRLLNQVRLPVPAPIYLNIEPDWRLLLYSAAVALVCAVIAGLIPAWRASRFGFGSRQMEGGTRLRGALVAGQVAVTFVVLAAAMLFARNLARSSSMNPGFEADRVVWASARLVPDRYGSDASIQSLQAAGLERLRALPGVEAASLVRVVPFHDQETRGGAVRAEGRDEPVHVKRVMNRVSSDYFGTMGIAITAGRTFQDAETNVTVINEELARILWNGADAVGRTLRIGESALTVVGVCRNSKFLTIGEDDKPAMYEPYRVANSDRRHRVEWMVRTQVSPGSLVNAVERAVLALDPSAAVEVRPMHSAMGMALLPSQIGAGLMGVAGALGLVLAAIGLYGVLVYSVARRRREIGVRMALGARAADVLAMVLGDASRIVGIGIALGLTAAIFLMRPLAMFLVAGLSPGDPGNHAMVAGVLALVALAACAVPSMRAIRVNPTETLRCE